MIDGALYRDYPEGIAEEIKDCFCFGVALLARPMIDAIEICRNVKGAHPDSCRLRSHWFPGRQSRSMRVADSAFGKRRGICCEASRAKLFGDGDPDAWLHRYAFAFIIFRSVNSSKRFIVALRWSIGVGSACRFRLPMSRGSQTGCSVRVVAVFVRS